jgi:A/G-specific adenine glycosylase
VREILNSRGGRLSENNDQRSSLYFREKFAELLLEWWGLNRRDFPWRRTKDPYKILITEMLLRKTTARQVSEIFDKFFDKFPDAKILAEAQDEEIKGLIRSLGMEHKRAVLLKKLANELLKRHMGRVPANPEDLRRLPGVGPYAANAVLCFAYGKDAPLVDVNVIRVFQRVFGYKPQKRRAKDDTALWNFVAETIPLGRARDFNFAIIDFAHEVCTPKEPKCALCSLHIVCKYANEVRKIEDQ